MRSLVRLVVCLVVVCTVSEVGAAEIAGHYLETRTCQVYTGPCFANSEMGLAGKDAVMAWSIRRGSHAGVPLGGLKVVMALRCSTTLGHAGLADAADLKSVIYVDEKGTEQQRAALVDFVKTHAGMAAERAVRITAVPIEMSLDEIELRGQLSAGKDVQLETRKARPTDCICTNEIAFYPPLAQVDHFAAGVTTQGEFRGRGLGTRWSTPESRSAYMATFAY